MQNKMTPDIQALFMAIASVQNAQECQLFLEDICTIKEIQAMAQRLQVAAQLRDGKNYNEVCADTGASSATISRVSRCLNYGEGGYRLVLERMEAGE